MSQKSELRDGMRIDWDVPIPMDDGLVLRADIYRPPFVHQVLRQRDERMRPVPP
ncbi:MAG: hypothetical protein Q7V48_01485 [Deltaproteobacteria bacterium]|nr:hypothetical protein [Deltaproteobacteria bacterium]